MFNNLGYKKNLFILPFDHRSSFAKLFGFTNAVLTQEEKEIITKAKEIIYEAFEKAVSEGISKEDAAILIDEEYGDKIIRDAINQNYNVILIYV
jgi:myo-inositol catabolism protein IolC